MFCYSWILHIIRRGHTTSAGVYKHRDGVPNIVKGRKLQYFGHMIRVHKIYTYFEGMLNCKNASICNVM